MGGWVDGHFDIFFVILLKPPQPFTGLFLPTFTYLQRPLIVSFSEIFKFLQTS